MNNKNSCLKVHAEAYDVSNILGCQQCIGGCNKENQETNNIQHGVVIQDQVNPSYLPTNLIDFLMYAIRIGNSVVVNNCLWTTENTCEELCPFDAPL